MKETKVCSRCGEEKRIGCFRICRIEKDGRYMICRDCERYGYPDIMKRLFLQSEQPELVYLVKTFGEADMNDIVVELRARGYRGSVKQMAVQMYVCETGMKRCSRCKEYKPIGEFTRDVGFFNGYGRCLSCNRQKNKEVYQKSKKNISPRMAKIKELADKCRELRIRKVLDGC